MTIDGSILARLDKLANVPAARGLFVETDVVEVVVLAVANDVGVEMEMEVELEVLPVVLSDESTMVSLLALVMLAEELVARRRDMVYLASLY